MSRRHWLLLLILITTLPSIVYADTSAHLKADRWNVETIYSGLNVPWGLSFLDSNRMLVSERNGQIGILYISDKRYQPIYQLPDVVVTGQGGLLDIAQSPFEPHKIYFTYAKRSNKAIETVLAQATLNKESLSEVTVLFIAQSGSTSGRHFGSRIAFDDKYLYFSIGDRAERDNGQDLTTHAGSIVRLNPDGTIPSDNPFTTKPEAQDAIWSYGHRNPQGLIFDKHLDRLWSVEHGPRGGDEINIIAKGKNYGWPITSHGKEYWGPIAVGEAKEKQGIVSPSKVYIPSIAPSSLAIYRHDKHNTLNNALLIGALKLTHINVVKLDAKGNIASEQRILQQLGERIRDIEVSKDGEIYFSTDSGKIYRLVAQ